MSSQVHTVLGEINHAGVTLTHEHLLHSLNKNVFKTSLPYDFPKVDKEAITLKNLSWIRQYPYSFDVNLTFDDNDVVQAVKQEMLFYKSNGGNTIVENSSIGLRSKNHASYLKKLSKDTGVNIVMGTGFYVANAHEGEILNYSCEEMQQIMKKDLLDGVDGADIKCGVIGELGCSWPLIAFERRVLKAAGEIQEELKFPVIIHPGRNEDSPIEIVRIFTEAGGKPHRTVMSHLDRTFKTDEQFIEFASQGLYSEFDLFGVETSHYQPADHIDMPNDGQRISYIKKLIVEGFVDKILISHDIHTKHRLMEFGGHGYSHILLNIIPKMTKRGIASTSIHKITHMNPTDWLSVP